MTDDEDTTFKGAMRPREHVRSVADLLAAGYLRHRKRLARDRARESMRTAEKTLDDVTPEGRVPLPENRTPEREVKP